MMIMIDMHVVERGMKNIRYLNDYEVGNFKNYAHK